jgi:hypothetical protein
MKPEPSFIPASKAGKVGSATDLIGRNFFKEVEPFTTSDDLRSKIASFTDGTSIADSFRSAFHLDNDSLPIKVLLARIVDRTNAKRTKSVMVHIKDIA